MRTYCFPISGYSQQQQKKPPSGPVALGLATVELTLCVTCSGAHSSVALWMGKGLEGEWGSWQAANN